jgi:phosphatidylinositol alpha-1,6-mannosyltransferase
VGVLARRVSRLPVLIYAHGEEITGWRERIKQAVMRWTYQQADAVVANSAFTRDRLSELGVDGHRVAVVHPGVDVKRFGLDVDGRCVRDELGIGSAPLILSVGRLQRRKGFDRIIASLPMLGQALGSVHYVVVGSGDDGARLKRLALENTVADRVHLVGQVCDAQLPEWYAACDVFAMPNRDVDGDTEGFGMVYLEAAACGKCVLAGRDGGTGSAVIDGITGLRVDGHSVDAVADGLRRLLTNRDMAETMGRQGYTRVRQDLTWSAVARRTCALHEWLAASRHTPSALVQSLGPSPLVRWTT